MTVTRHEFLARLHHLLQPVTYLEIGVHTGESLSLSSAPITIGVDPHPMLASISDHVQVHAQTSDEFFVDRRFPKPIDLAFIDGMHLWEFALRDFVNIEANSHSHTVVVFDDVLPYSDAIASRTQPPGGDWTGDVWKVIQILALHREDVELMLVDTFPTGSLVVWYLDPSFDWKNISTAIMEEWGADERPVPEAFLTRADAVSADDAMRRMKEWWLG